MKTIMEKKYTCEEIEKNSTYYPKEMKALSDAPNKIYLIGNKECLNDFSIAIVGARRCTALGKEYAQTISDEIAQEGITIVSGFATGIDTVAHLSAIRKKQKTIAVLAGGFHYIYPPENIELIDDIINNGGAIISEYSIDVEPIRQRFPQRNRIIAAMSSGVLVIEAGKKSGSLITAEYAKKYHKKLFVLPGKVSDENYEGSNQLLVDGAKCILNAKDVLKEYPEIVIGKKQSPRKRKKVPKEYTLVYNMLNNPTDASQLARALSKQVSEIQVTLTMMELDNYIMQVGPGLFMKR